MAQPDDLVLYAFRAPIKSHVTPEHMGYAWDNGWRVGDVVYTQAASYAGWSAKIREKISVPGARIARPVVATNGNYVVGGWKATYFISGQLARRIDETAQLALRLEDAIAAVGIPAPARRTDIFAQAEVAAWAETGEGYEAWGGDEAFAVDAPSTGEAPAAPVPAPGAQGERGVHSLGVSVTGHADLLATTIFQGSNQPAIVDIVPTAQPRPKGYSAALVIVDGLINEAVDPGICDRFGYVPGLDQLLLRAVAYRRYINNYHPAAKTMVRSRIEAVEDMLLQRVL